MLQMNQLTLKDLKLVTTHLTTNKYYSLTFLKEFELQLRAGSRLIKRCYKKTMPEGFNINSMPVSVSALSELYKNIAPQNDQSFGTITEAIRISKNLSKESGLSGYMNDFLIKKWVKENILSGSIEYDANNIITSSKVNLEEIKLWTSILGSFQLGTEITKATQVNKGTYIIKLKDRANGKGEVDNKIDAVAKMMKLIYQGIPESKKEEFNKIMGIK